MLAESRGFRFHTTFSRKNFSANPLYHPVSIVTVLFCVGMASSRTEVLKIYKNMLRESGKFSFYNYRMYAVRRVKDAFREHKALRDPSEIQQNLKDANKFLEIIKRQVIVGDLYKFEKLVIEVDDNDKKH